MTPPYPECINAMCRSPKPNVWQAPYWICEQCGIALGMIDDGWIVVNWTPHYYDVATETLTSGGVKPL